MLHCSFMIGCSRSTTQIGDSTNIIEEGVDVTPWWAVASRL
jgi:hypothetical protein